MLRSITLDFTNEVKLKEGVQLDNESCHFAAAQLEFRLRTLIQDAFKFKRHQHQNKLSTDHIKNAISLKRSKDVVDTMWVNNKKSADEAEPLSDILSKPLWPVPHDMNMDMHWLAIRGVVPSTVENCIRDEDIAVNGDIDHFEEAEETSGGIVTPKVTIRLTQEYKLYLETLIFSVRNQNDKILDAVLKSISRDAGLSQLLPSLSKFIAEEFFRSIKSSAPNLNLITSLIRILERIFESPHLGPQTHSYLHQLLPVVVSCAVTDRLSERWSDDHWQVRKMAAKVISLGSSLLFSRYSDLRRRLAVVFKSRLLDPNSTLTQAYGCLLGLNALGPCVVKSILHPSLADFLKMKVKPIMEAMGDDTVLNHTVQNLRSGLELSMITSLVMEMCGGYLKMFYSVRRDKTKFVDFPWVHVIADVFGESMQMWQCDDLTFI